MPLRMEAFHGTDGTIAQYMNTGGWGDGHLIGWPDCKVFIPLDFTRTQFPGGYPNDNGINIMHDDFLGARQPETLALFELAARERPDLILDLHTGAGLENYYPRMLRPVTEDALTPVFNGLYRAVQTALARQDCRQRATLPLKRIRLTRQRTDTISTLPSTSTAARFR